MFGFRRNAQGEALLSGTRISDLLARASVGTPAYLYDLDGLGEAAGALEASFGDAPHVIAYAVKANTAGSVIRTLAARGVGADVVSGAELEVALGAGVPAERIVMSGVAKQDWELDLALGRKLHAVQVESIEELERLAARARALGVVARVALRINPSVELDGHAHVATGHDAAKFGVATADVGAAWERVARTPELRAVGVSSHVGSMLHDTEPYLRSARAVCDAARAGVAKGLTLEYVSFGGGFGIDYGGKPAAEPSAFVRSALGLLAEQGLGSFELVIEPGRSLVGPFGVLAATVVQAKQSGGRRWVMIDAGMNDLIRPALYGAKHRIEPLERAPSDTSWRVVGPVCESSDDFGEHPLGPEPPAHVAVRDAGAYGFVMASEYNGRPLPAEVFVSGGEVTRVSASPGRAAWVRRRLDA
ncbi:MAG TPA: diaminopimelate decarboxylase [Polyangiaceae bacterium]